MAITANSTAVLRRLGLLLLIAALFGVSPVASQPVAASSPWINTSSRDAVIAAYENEFGGTDPTTGWTGNRASCNPGTTSQAYRDAVFSRVNFFRGMAGVPNGVTENATWSAMAQESALMMSASAKLSHNPTASEFTCFTADGATASASSDLYLGRTGAHAITGYMEDPGSGNARVGHRNWILHPTTTQMGTGDIPADGNGWAANTLWVFDNVFGTQPTLRENNGMVAWPPRGYVPGELVFPRWSLSARNGDFSNASVTMTTGGDTVPLSLAHRDGATNGAPFPIVVWEPTNIDPNPTFDVTYTVTVSGAKVNGNPTNFSYNVTIIGSQEAGGVDPAAYNDFVTQAYIDFVGRAPNSSELGYWSSQLVSGTTRFAFVEALSNSDAWTANVVDQLYLDTLGRPGEGAGEAYWTGRLQDGASVAEVAASFYGSQEYVDIQGGTHDQWIRDLYQVLLYRNADNGGLSYWTAETAAAGTGTVAYRFYQSQESREARVRALYQQFLGRNPDAAGLAYWAGVLESGDDLALAANLASSDEYLQRASN